MEKLKMHGSLAAIEGKRKRLRQAMLILYGMHEGGEAPTKEKAIARISISTGVSSRLAAEYIKTIINSGVFEMDKFGSIVPVQQKELAIQL